MPKPAHRLRRLSTAVLALALTGVGAAAVPAPAAAAVGDEVIAWLEVEQGEISGGPALNSGDHGNFSGTGSYTFRETGMTSEMTVTAPAAGAYPVWIRYAAGPLSAEENVTRGMGLLTDDGDRQTVPYPLTGSWESWGWAQATVDLDEGVNTLAVSCDRAVEMCRLNLDAVQVGGTAPDPCAVAPAPAGATRLFDGSFASFDQWRKSGSGGFGQQVVRDPATGAYDCTLRGFRGQGTTWTTAQHAGPYTLGVDWRRGDAAAGSSVYVASPSNATATPAGGYRVHIGATDTGAITYGATTQPADAAAVAAAVLPVGQWNRFAVQVTPQRIRVLLNGTPVNAVDRTASMAGHIGLENRAGTDQVGFRDIQLTPDVVLGELSGPARRAATADGTAHPGDESTLANLVADSQRWATRGSAGGNARIALVAATSLQADLVPADGGVTYAAATSAVTAEPLVNLRLTGAQVETVLEQQWQPDGGFVSLGASSGLTWTHDPGRPLGERITGTWLDGVPLDAALNYSVTAAASLAAGSDDFPGFAAGIGRRTPDASTHSALAAHLGDGSASGPLDVPRTQRGVGVHVPGGATSWVAGTTYALDLSSWSYSATSDPVDDTVAVTVGGRAVGSFAVDDGQADPGEHGTVAVRAALPIDLPAGATTVEVVGSTTGTTVRLPVTVVDAPPAPTPVPTTEPTPVLSPTTPPAPARASATVKVKVKPGRVVARKTRARLVVTVAGGTSTPTGKVTARLGARKVRGTLREGRVVLRLPVLARPGRVKVTVAYAGDSRTLAAKKTVRIRAVAP